MPSPAHAALIGFPPGTGTSLVSPVRFTILIFPVEVPVANSPGRVAILYLLSRLAADSAGYINYSPVCRLLISWMLRGY